MKYILYIIITFFIVGCAKPDFQYTSKQIIINNNDTLYDIKLQEPKEIPRFNYCAFDGYTLNDTNISLEHIELKSSCSWTGLAEGYYRDFLNDNIKELKKVSSYSVDKADIYFYKTQNKYFYLISLYDVSSNTFILDYTGEIASKLTEKTLQIPKHEQLTSKFEKSMLDNDILGHYFEKDNSEEIIIIP